ncbi:MAG: SDR family NAD(P)-dependent oxidoreductase [Chloroflexi bacterium]|nr:SDR family NAD(P)-dependent oxidoreductase [Chloroflexota bacterium]
MTPLAGKVALVTGASRGIGKGIALALGAAGATVYLTGRTESAAEATVPLPGTIHETAALVHETGGQGIALRCDHADDRQVQQVVERIAAEQGRLDILVNNAWSGYQRKQQSRTSGFHTPFWKSPPEFWDTMHTVGVRSHYVASVYGTRLMVAQGHGLIVHVSAPAGGGYSENVAYGVSKAAVDRMAADMAHELQETGVAVVSLWPGIVATEMIMARRKDQRLQPYMESPVYVGRAVVGLALDADLMAKSGQILVTRDLGAEYGFQDVNGHQPSLEKGVWRPAH